MNTKFLDKKTRQDMIDELVGTNVNCMMDDTDSVDNILRNGFIGYDKMSDDDILDEFNTFYGCDYEDDEPNELYEKAFKMKESKLADKEISKMLKTKKGKKK